jgi:ATP-dependent DNA ligase
MRFTNDLNSSAVLIFRMTSADIERRLNSLPPGSATFKEPMECLAVPKLPHGSQLVYQIKLDGYRAIAVKSSGKLNLLFQAAEFLQQAIFSRLRSSG